MSQPSGPVGTRDDGEAAFAMRELVDQLVEEAVDAADEWGEFQGEDKVKGRQSDEEDATAMVRHMVGQLVTAALDASDGHAALSDSSNAAHDTMTDLVETAAQVAAVKCVVAGKKSGPSLVTAGKKALLELFAMCIGVGKSSRQVSIDALQRVARYLNLEGSDVAEALVKGSEPLDEQQWRGLVVSRAETFRQSCSNWRQDSVEALLWVVGGVLDNGACKFYDPRIRAGVRRFAERLGVGWRTVASFEFGFTSEAEMQGAEKAIEMSMREAKRSGRRDWKRSASIGAAAGVGAGLLAATGLLALPAAAAALSTVASATGATVFGTVATAAGSATGMALTGSTLGAAGAGLVGHKMQRRMGNIQQFEFVDNTTQPLASRAAVTIAISGWVTKSSDFTAPWNNLSLETHEEVNCLIWEETELTALGNMMVNFLYDQAAGAAMELLFQRTVLHGLVQAIAWPATVISAAGLIDNEWSVAINRADEAGKLLAEILMRNFHGFRPVSLVGYSLGARTIHVALQCLKKQNRFDIVENAVFLGAPVSSKPESWRDICDVTAGRVINAYASDDWVLAFLYRTSHLNFSVAGLEPVELARVQNVDVLESLELKCNYRDNCGKILRSLGLYSK